MEDPAHVFQHSRSYRLFLHKLDQIHALLTHAIAGLTEGRKTPDNIIERIERAKAGLPPIPVKEPTIKVELDSEEIELIKSALEAYKKHQDRLPFYLNSVLLIALWSGFESYLQGIVVQMFGQNPSELASDKQLSVRELIERSGGIADYLIEREVNDFGHLSLEGMFQYLKTRLKFNFQDQEIALLKELYFLRNIAAHNSGFIRISQRPMISDEIEIYHNQIEIPLNYLKRGLFEVFSLVRRADAYIVERWNIPKSTEALFEETLNIATDEAL